MKEIFGKKMILIKKNQQTTKKRGGKEPCEMFKRQLNRYHIKYVSRSCSSKIEPYALSAVKHVKPAA